MVYSTLNFNYLENIYHIGGNLVVAARVSVNVVYNDNVVGNII